LGAVAIQELMHTVGVLDPGDSRTAAVVDATITGSIHAIPEHRLFTPDAEVLGRAALLAGILSRLQGYVREARLKALQDCVLFLQAQKLGFALLTANPGGPGPLLSRGALMTSAKDHVELETSIGALLDDGDLHELDRRLLGGSILRLMSFDYFASDAAPR
jgi:hypothetical protein